MRYCPKCRVNINGDEAFCPRCGANLSNSNFRTAETVSEKSRTVCLLLAIFLGIFGIHRFYTEKIGTGILMLLLSTTGIGEIWCLIDIIFIIAGKFEDKHGDLILIW